MSPRNERRQLVLAAEVEVSPATGTYRYEDSWDTIVTAFDLHVPHETPAVTATSTVDTLSAADQPDAAGELSWAELAEPAPTDRWHELLLPTPVPRWTRNWPRSPCPYAPRSRRRRQRRWRSACDVPPLKGVFSGSPQTGQTVEVELTRLR